MVKKCLAAFINHTDTLCLILKFLGDLLDNSSNRLKFDTWNINGLIIFQETSALMIELMEITNCLSPVDATDVYDQVLRILKVLLGMVTKLLSGNFINFAICDFYSDQTFGKLSSLMFRCVFNQDLK